MGLLEVLGLRYTPEGVRIPPPLPAPQHTMGISLDEPNTRVKMVVSIDHYKGEEVYDLPHELSDSYILRGYATGNLSREYTSEEESNMRSNSQVVGV